MVPADMIAYKMVILILAGINIVISILFLALPSVFARLNDFTKKWIPTDKLEEALNKRHEVDGKIFGVQKFIGVASLAITILLLFCYSKI